MQKLITLLIYLGASSFLFCQIDDSTTAKSQKIEEIIVTADKSEELIFESKTCFIIDFQIGSNGNFLLLKRLGKYYAYLLNDRLEHVSEIKLNFKPRKLFFDCLGNTHIISKEHMHQLGNINDTLKVIEKNSMMLYHRFFKYCEGRNSAKVIFSNRNNQNQSLTYHSVSRSTQEKELLYTIEDSVIVKSINEERERILAESCASSSHRQAGNVDYSDDRSNIKNMREAMQRKFFYELILTLPTYHPLYVQNDTTYIFDHLNNCAVVLDTSGVITAKKPIDYHQKKDWKESILLDEDQGMFYTSYGRGAAIRYARLGSDFKENKRSGLDKHQVLKKVIIHNGFAYYTVRPYYEANLNKLYRQKL